MPDSGPQSEKGLASLGKIRQKSILLTCQDVIIPGFGLQRRTWENSPCHDFGSRYGTHKYRNNRPLSSGEISKRACARANSHPDVKMPAKERYLYVGMRRIILKNVFVRSARDNLAGELTRADRTR